MIAELSQLIALQETDVEIKRCNIEISALPGRQAEIEQNFAVSAKEFLALKTEFETSTAERLRLETEVAAENAKHEKFKADLMKATNEREYTTAVREIDATRKVISTLETELLKMMEKVEKLEVQVNERSPEIEASRAVVDKQIKVINKAVKADQEKLATMHTERLQLLAKLSPPTRATYERVARLKSGLALSLARNYSCTACRMTIRPQVFNELRRGEKIIECENCGRILYYKADAEVATI